MYKKNMLRQVEGSGSLLGAFEDTLGRHVSRKGGEDGGGVGVGDLEELVFGRQPFVCGPEEGLISHHPVS